MGAMAKLSKETMELADGLHSAAIHLLRQLRVEDRASGIGPAQLSALSVLVFGGNSSLRDLAAAEQVKPPTMVRIVHSLVEQRLAISRADPEDARKVIISATGRGSTLMQRARLKRVKALARTLAQKAPVEREQLRTALAVLRSLRTSAAKSKGVR